MKHLVSLLLLIACLSCSDQGSDTPESIRLLGAELNGAPLRTGATGIDTAVQIDLTFSRQLALDAVEQALSLTQNGVALPVDLSLINNATRARIRATLQPDRAYTLRLAEGAIGQAGAVLAEAVSYTFTTRAAGPITIQAPCVSASASCLQQIDLPGGQLQYYASYPLQPDNARWEEVQRAIIVLHGQQRNAVDYFRYMTSALQEVSLAQNTILIAPEFKAPEDAGAADLGWASFDWREGRPAQGNGASSFAALDSIIAQLADAAHFPALERILITGHSSGALLTHLYAAANRAEQQFSTLQFDYGVANSQYFYYPEPLRWNASTQQFVVPGDCASYQRWPYGYQQVPDYLQNIPEATVDQQLVERSVTYFLGTRDTLTTGSLNTRDCAAVLLGRDRFRRGENILRLIEQQFPGTEEHSQLEVPGIGHNGDAMYNSQVFLDWLKD